MIHPRLDGSGRMILAANNQIGCRAIGLFREMSLEISLVLAHPDPRPDELIPYPSAAETARSYGIPVLQSPSLRPLEIQNQLAAIEPEAIFSVGYGKILPQTLLDVPRFGCINLHGSFLPWYRGRFCSVWAIINGETSTGVTVHFMQAGIDTGDIIAQEVVPILPDESAKQLYERQMQVGYELLRNVISQLLAGTYQRFPQIKEKGSYFSGRTFDDNRIDWSQPARRIRNLVRACDFAPYPPAFTEIDGTSWGVRWIDILVNRPRPLAVPSGTLIDRAPDFLVMFAGDYAVVAWLAASVSNALQPGRVAGRAGP